MIVDNKFTLFNSYISHSVSSLINKDCGLAVLSHWLSGDWLHDLGHWLSHGGGLRNGGLLALDALDSETYASGLLNNWRIHSADDLLNNWGWLNNDAWSAGWGGGGALIRASLDLSYNWGLLNYLVNNRCRLNNWSTRGA